MTSFIEELKRRHVIRVCLAYLVVAWLILQLTDLVFENMNAPDWVMQAIMLLLAIGFPVALILAWAFEMTPDGVQREDPDPAQAAQNTQNSRLFYTVVVLIAVGGVGLYMMQDQSDSMSATDVAVETADSTADSTDDESLLAIAVLPFESFTEDREDQYFADGLADTLLHKLAQLETLTVIARNSSFQFKGQNVDVREIGEKLGVPTILEGSVQRQGNQIRVIAQLVSTKDGAHWWSGTFDGTFDNVFGLQDEIAAAITEQLQITLSDRDRERLFRNGTAVPAAYETLTRARAINTNFDEVGYEVDSDPKLALLREVVMIDPNYALGWTGLSHYYNELAFHGIDESRFDEFAAESKAAAERAIEVDPGEEDAYVAMGFANWRLSEVGEAEANYRKALSINPNNDGALSGLGLAVFRTDPEEAYRLFSRVQQIDPNSTIVYRQLFLALSTMGRLAEGIEKLEEGIRRDPDFFIFYSDLANAYSRSFGQHAKATRVMSDLLQRSPNSRTGLYAMAEYWYAVNDPARANAWLNLLLQNHPTETDGLYLKILLLQLAGDVDSAMAIANSLPRDGFGEFDRGISMTMLCMTKRDAACAVEAIDGMNVFYRAFRQRSGSELAEISYLLNVINGWADLPDTEAAISGLERAERGLSVLPVLYAGGRERISRAYLRAAALAILDRFEEAVAELNLTLGVADGGFVETDMFGLLPENSLLLEPLRAQPGYDDWLAKFTARRTAMRGEMIAMEAAGEIARAP